MLLGYTSFSILSALLPEQWDKRLFLIVGHFLLGLAPFLIGPSRLLHLPDSASLVGVGLFLGGGGRGVITCFTVA